MATSQPRTSVSQDARDFDVMSLRHDIELVLDEVAALAKAELSVGSFAERLSYYVTRATGSAGSIVWSSDERGELSPVPPFEDERLRPLSLVCSVDHDGLVQGAFESARGTIVPARSMTDAIGTAANPTNFAVVLQPVLLLERPAAVIEVFFKPESGPEHLRTAQEIAASIAELASEFYLRQAVRVSSGHKETLVDFDLLMQELGRTRKADETIFAVVNQGRRFLQCDRVALALSGRWNCSLRAMSGVSKLNRRSNSVRTLELLVGAVVAGRRPLYYPDTNNKLRPDVRQRLDDYLADNPTCYLAILPLTGHRKADSDDSPAPIGALVVEHFQDELPASVRARISLLADHSGRALLNSVGRRSGLAQSPRLKKLVTFGAIVAFLSAAVCALVMIPADFTVQVQGRLEPRLKQHVYAPSGGIARTIHVTHSQAVTKDQPLIVLENPDLELQYERVRGEIRTVRKRALALDATRGTQSFDAGSDVTPGLVAGQQQELKEKLANLEAQQKLIESQRSALAIKSPLEGEVTTWNPDDVLQDRPVERGQRLVTVAATKGDWTLELLIPDGKISHVLDAQKALGANLPVTYILASDPGRTYETTIESIAPTAELYEDSHSYVLAKSALKEGDIALRRPGTTVVGSIRCGRRSLGYVWLHELFETIQKRFLL